MATEAPAVELIDIGKDARHALIIGSAIRRHGDAAGRAVEQLGAQVRLKPLDQLAQRRLRDGEHLRCTGEGPHLDNAGECPHRGQLVHPTPCLCLFHIAPQQNWPTLL